MSMRYLFGDIFSISSDNSVAIVTFHAAFLFLPFDWTFNVNMESSVVCLNQKGRNFLFISTSEILFTVIEWPRIAILNVLREASCINRTSIPEFRDSQ